MKELKLNMKECVVRIKTDMLLSNKRIEIRKVSRVTTSQVHESGTCSSTEFSLGKFGAGDLTHCTDLAVKKSLN